MKKKSKTKNKLSIGKIIKYSIIVIILVIIAIASYLVYKNIFSGVENTRYEGIENYKLTSKEKNNVKEKLNEIENIKNVNIYTNSKIIKIHIILDKDTKFENVKEICNESLEKFSEENLKFYDVEVFVESNDKESSLYPQIGYKHKTNSKFSW